MEGGGFTDFLKDPINTVLDNFRNPTDIAIRKENAAFDQISKEGKKEEEERQRRIDKGESEEILNLPNATPGVFQKTSIFFDDKYQTAKNTIKRLRQMVAKDEILVLGERVVLEEAGFDPSRYNDRVSFKQKYFYTIQDGAELEMKKNIFKKYFNEASQMSVDNPRPPCALDEKQVLLEGLMNRFNTLRTEIRILSRKTPDSIDLRQRIDHVMRLKSFMEMLDSQPDCLSYDQNGQVSIINGDPSIKDEELELLLKRFAILVLQAKNPMRSDIRVDPTYARAIVAEVQKLENLDTNNTLGYIGERKDPDKKLRTPEMFRQLLEGDPLIKAGSTESELREIKDALEGDLDQKNIEGWSIQKATLAQIYKDDTRGETEKLKGHIGAIIAWILKKYQECFNSIQRNQAALEANTRKAQEQQVEIDRLTGELVAAKAAAKSGDAAALAAADEASRELQDAKRAAEVLRVEKAGLEARNNALQAQVTELSETLRANEAKYTSELARLRGELERNTAELEARSAALAAVQAEITAGGENTELTQREKQLQAQIKGLRETAAKRKSQLDEWQSKYAKQTNEITKKDIKFQEQMTGINEQIRALEATLAERTSQYEASRRLLVSNESLLAERDLLVQRAKQSDTRRQKFEIEIERLRGENERLNRENGRIADLQSQLEALRGQAAQAAAAGDNKIPLETLQGQVDAIKAALQREGGLPQEIPGEIGEGGPLADLYRQINTFAIKNKASIESARGYQLCYLNFIVTYFLKRFLKEGPSKRSILSLELSLDGVLGAIRAANGRQLYEEGRPLTAETYKKILDILFPLLASTETLYLNGVLGPSAEAVPEGYYSIRQYDIYAGDDRKQGEERGKMTQLNDMLFTLYKHVKQNKANFGNLFESAIKPMFKTSKTHVGFRPPFVPQGQGGAAYMYPYNLDDRGYSPENRNLFTNPIVVYSTAENISDLDVNNFRSTFGLYDVQGNRYVERLNVEGDYQNLLAGKADNIRRDIREADKPVQEQRHLLSYEFLFSFFLLVARRYLREKENELRLQGCPLPQGLNSAGINDDAIVKQFANDIEVVGAPPPPPPARPAGPPAAPAGPAEPPAPPPPAAPPQQPQPPVPRISNLTPKAGVDFLTEGHIKKIIDGVLRQIGGGSTLFYINELKNEIDNTYTNVGSKSASKFLADKSYEGNLNKFIHKYQNVVNKPFKTIFIDSTNDIRTFWKSFFKFISPKTLETQRNYNLDTKRKEIRIILKKFFERLLAVYIDTFPGKNPDFTRDELQSKLDTIRPIFKSILSKIILDVDIQSTPSENIFLAKRTGSGTGPGLEYVFTGDPTLDSIVQLQNIKVNADKKLVVEVPNAGGGTEEVDLLNQLG